MESPALILSGLADPELLQQRFLFRGRDKTVSGHGTAHSNWRNTNARKDTSSTEL